MADSAERQASPRSEQAGLRYSAFISYNSHDAPIVRRLHRRLETYRLPRRLVGKSPTVDSRTHRIKPIFRDNLELSAAYDLTAAVRDAIAQSDYLIVVCSPRSAQSEWVGREIELFRALHGDSHILAALVDGTPQTAFHPALHGHVPAVEYEPLAADFRPGASGHKLAFLKLIAALVGVRLDELLQRDAQRQIRQITGLAIGSVAGVAIVAVLGLLALNARAEAEAQRLRAGSLGAFMLTDLRKGLRSAGRLDLQMAVNKAALSYYRGQDLSRLPPDDLVQRATALQAMGEDNEKRGELKAAQAEFEEARRTTGALLAAKPDDPRRIFAHAQSEYWVGFINWRNGDGAAAKASFEAYARAAQRLVSLDPHNDDWLMERVYAENNLGTLALRQAGDAAEAERHFRAVYRDLDSIIRRKPGDPDAMSAKATVLAWLADSQRVQGHLEEALASREAQRTILAGLLAKNPRDVEVRSDMLGHDLAVARIEAEQGQARRAIRRLQAGHEAAMALVRTDPDDADFAKQARMFELFEVRTWLAMPARSRPPLATIAGVLGDCAPRTRALTDEEIGDFCAILLARLRAASGDYAGARTAMAAAPRHASGQLDALTAHWGLNLRDETRMIEMAENTGGPK